MKALLEVLFNWPPTCKAFVVLALGQSLPSYEANTSPSASDFSSFAANSTAGNQVQSFSSSLNFSQTLASLQTENPSSSTAAVSFPPSSPFQSGTTSYSPYSTNQYSQQYSNSSPWASSDNRQSVPASPTGEDSSSSVQGPSIENETENTTATQEYAENGASTGQGFKKGPSPASSGVAQQDENKVTGDSRSALIADQQRPPINPSTGAQQTSAAGTKAGDTGKPETGKRNKKANEAAQAGIPGQEQSDSVAATLLAAANSSATAPAAEGASPAASDFSAETSSVTKKNDLAAAANSPNALAFAVRLQSASSATGGAAVSGAANLASAAPQTGDSAGGQGPSKFAEQLQAVSGAAQEPASLQGAALATMPGTTGFAAMNTGTAQASADTEKKSPQIIECDGPDAGASTGSPAPLRSMQVQINGQDNQRVDLRLVERAGTLSMSVRSLDSTLNRNLQDHLPELLTKLSDQPGQAEWWTPKTQMTGGGEGSANGGGGKEDSAGSKDQPSQTGQDSSKQQGGRQSNQPKWVEELAALGNSNTTRKETIWHQ